MEQIQTQFTTRRAPSGRTLTLNLLAALVLSACGGGDSSDKAITNVAIDGKIKLIGDGAEPGGVVASVRGDDSASATLDKDGNFSLNIAASDKDRTITIDLIGDDIIDKSATVSIPAGADSVSFEDIVGALAAPVSFNVDTGGIIEDASQKVTLTLPTGAFEDEDGNPVSGEAQVSITNIDLSAIGSDQSFAPDLIGIDGNGEAAAIFSYGMADFEFSQGDKTLSIKDGFSADIQFDLNTEAVQRADGSFEEIKVGTTIPMWHYDLDRSIWVKEGEATVAVDPDDADKLVVKGSVSHFSTWNIDELAPFAGLNIKLVGNDENDNNPSGEIRGATARVITRIPASAGPGWHAEAGWSSTSHIGSSGRVTILANNAERAQNIADGFWATGYTQMEVIVDNIKVPGQARTLGPYRVLKEFHLDSSRRLTEDTLTFDLSDAMR